MYNIRIVNQNGQYAYYVRLKGSDKIVISGAFYNSQIAGRNLDLMVLEECAKRLDCSITNFEII